jgi:molecular chaperone GrpE (heat shock protein)
MLRPILYDLVLVVDRIARSSGEPGPEGRLAGSVMAEIEGLLGKYGATRMATGSGTFDPSFQEAVGVTPIGDRTLHGKVAEVVRHGYGLGDRTLRPQQVRVYAAEDPRPE